MKSGFATVLAACLLWSVSAHAADIYVNGQQVRGITNLTLDNCTVTFNARGDLYVSAPEFKVLSTAATGTQATETAVPVSDLKNRYFLFTQTSSPGQVPYKFEVWVNGKQVKSFTSAQDKLTIEITLYLKKGNNSLEIKSLREQSEAGSGADTFSILVGRGEPKQGTLEIHELLLNYARKGSDYGDAADTFYIDAK